jgi:signal transduction protein with GAF and PtsI domain
MLSKQKLNQIAKHKDFNKLLKGILDLAQDILDSEAATLFLIDHETNELIFQIVNGPTARQLEGKRIGMGDGIVGKSAELV